MPFVDGVAEFTRLRVDRQAEQLSLSFTTVPERFHTETTVVFSVVGFPESVERRQVSFLMTGVAIPDSLQWNGIQIVREMTRQIAAVIDVDPSRIINMEMHWVRYSFS